MTLQCEINGLVYDIISPSLYELVSVNRDVRDADARVFVAFSGHKWCIRYESAQVGVVMRPLPSRQAAFTLLSLRAHHDVATEDAHA